MTAATAAPRGERVHDARPHYGAHTRLGAMVLLGAGGDATVEGAV